MNEETKTSTKKQILTPGVATRSLINGFISYSFLIGFIFLIIYLVIINSINNLTNDNIPSELNYILPAILAIISFFLIRGICYLSTYDVFKKNKINKKDLGIICSNANLFFILLVLLSVALITISLMTRFRNERSNIEELKTQYYEIYDEKIADDLLIESIEEYTLNKNTTIFKTLTFEIGVILGLFSLFTHQRKLIEKFNQ